MAVKFNNPVPKPSKAASFSLPKEPQGRAQGASAAARTSASGYGKSFRIGGGESAIPMQSSSTQFTAKKQ